MKKEKETAYSKCVEWSIKSDEESLDKLITFYYNATTKENRNTARQALRKTKRKDLAIKNIDKRLEQPISNEGKLKLLKLGIIFNRKKYLYDYLQVLNCLNIDLKEAGFFHFMSQKDVSKNEMKEIARYIIDTRDYDSRLLGILDGAHTKQVLDSCLKTVLDEGISGSLMAFLRKYPGYINKVQELIRNAILDDSQKNFKYIKYLDFSIIENHVVLEKYDNPVLVYQILKFTEFEGIEFKNNKWVNVVKNIIKKERIDDANWENVKLYVSQEIKGIGDISEKGAFLGFLCSLTYLDYHYVENSLIELYKETKLYSDQALIALSRIKSNYAYREMIKVMLNSEDRKERYRFSVQALMNFPEKINSIYRYARELDDEKLIETLDDVARKRNLNVEDFPDIFISKEKKIQIIPNEFVLSEVLIDLAEEIKANCFYAAVGFTFTSGLKMLKPVFDYVNSENGAVEIISGSLQNIKNENKNIKIDKSTVIYLNSLIENKVLDLFTYEDTFYHGKIYYLSNDNKAFVIIGSSNISKTAFLKNFELDLLLEINKDDELYNEFFVWYDSFKKKCIKIEHIDTECYEDFKWDSELDVYSSRILKKMSYEEINLEIKSITDEEIKRRLNCWMRYKPTDIYANLGIKALEGYIVFLYANNGLAVFESFTPGNAYYIFKYSDFEELLLQVSGLTKYEMRRNSGYVDRGYHFKDIDKMEQNIAMLFV